MPLPPIASSSARQIMAAAFRDLEKVISPADARGFPDTTLQQVRQAALDIETQLASRQCLRNMRRLLPFFNGLEHYAHVMDVLCNGTPFLPWVWAPISLILRVSSEYVEAFEQIIKGYSRLAECLERFSKLEKAFPRDADFQQAMAVFYADILRFHGHAYKFVRRSSWKIFFMSSWGRFQRRFGTILKDMEQHERLIDLKANALNIYEAQKMRQDIRLWREESEAQLTAFEKEQSAKHFESIKSWLKADEAHQLALSESISAEGAKYPGTCSWVHQNAKMKSWLRRSHGSSILWLKGTPGSGKSILSSQIVAFMKNAGMFVVRHYCSYLYASSTSYEQILRSLLLQILPEDDELVEHAYNACVVEKKAPTVFFLEKLLQTLIGSMATTPSQDRHIWILIDGLDECEDNSQRRIVSLARYLTSKVASSGNVVCKVLVSSRTSLAITEGLRKSDVLSLTEEKSCLHAAIVEYINGRLQMLRHKLEQLHVGPNEVREIADSIATKTDGMFLYARLILDFIASNIFYNGQEIKDSVNQLPKELADFYRQSLAQILAKLNALSIERIKCLLGWVAFSKRPLKKLEFMSAVTFSSGDPHVSFLVPQDMFDMCALLVDERHDATVGFIHVSVKDFLQSTSSPLILNESDCVSEHGIAAVSCLLSGLTVFGSTYEEHDRCIRLIEGVHGFHLYATEYWTEYVLASIVLSRNGYISLWSSKLLACANNLALKLEELNQGYGQREAILENAQAFDPRLSHLQEYPLLQEAVVESLKDKSFENFEARLQENPRSKISENGILKLLERYQNTLGMLLNKQAYPGVSAVAFDRFKSQFQEAAFTCRLTSCPRATLGFGSYELRNEHELTHLRRFPCTAFNCPYPPFASANALRAHTNKEHCSPPRSSIRMSKPKATSTFRFTTSPAPLATVFTTLPAPLATPETTLSTAIDSQSTRGSPNKSDFFNMNDLPAICDEALFKAYDELAPIRSFSFHSAGQSLRPPGPPTLRSPNPPT